MKTAPQFLGRLATALCLAALAAFITYSLTPSSATKRPTPEGGDLSSPSQPDSIVTAAFPGAETTPPDAEQSGGLSPSLRRLAETDPLAAAARLSELPTALHVEFAAAIASAWGKRDPQLAAAWARDHLEGEPRNQALLSLSADWAAADPVAAAECALAVLPTDRQPEFLRTVGMQWARQDPAAAIAWADGLQDSAAHDSFLAGLASTLSETSPREAADLISSFSSPQLAQETAFTVILEWGRQEPELAADWVKLFPDGPLRSQALFGLTSLWAQQSQTSPTALLAWPQGPERDQAIRHYLDEILDNIPVRGLDVLSAITNPELRQEETQRVAQYWLNRDPDAARLYLGLPPPD